MRFYTNQNLGLRSSVILCLVVKYHHHHHHHHISVTQLGHLLTRSGLTYSEVSSKVYHVCPASFRETCQWLKFPLNGLRAQIRVSPAVGLLALASGPACLGMAFPSFLAKQLYRCDSVVISSFVRTACTIYEKARMAFG